MFHLALITVDMMKQ